MSEKRGREYEIFDDADRFFEDAFRRLANLGDQEGVEELSSDEFEDIYQEAVEKLSSDELKISRDDLFGVALPVFHMLGKPMPRMPIVVATLMDEEITESEARYLLGVLVETGSSENYTEELNFIRQKYPS